MTETTDSKKKSNPKHERFDVRSATALFTEQAERFLDEVERTSRASFDQTNKLVEESRKMNEAQLEVSERMLDITLENARRFARAFA